MNIPNWPLLTQAIEHIIDHPMDYEQSSWRCGTARCVAGWIAELSGGTWYTAYSSLIWPKGADQEDEDNLQDPDQCAIEALGVDYGYDEVSEMISNALFSGTLSWREVLRGLEGLAAEDGVTLSPKIQAEITRINEQEVPL